MRRFHNPRYAPEFLERKLSPSGIAAIPVPADVYVPATNSLADTNSPADTNSGGTIPDGDGDPPVEIPSQPTGPTLPA